MQQACENQQNQQYLMMHLGAGGARAADAGRAAPAAGGARGGTRAEERRVEAGRGACPDSEPCAAARWPAAAAEACSGSGLVGRNLGFANRS
jgi:hypothetical protein